MSSSMGNSPHTRNNRLFFIILFYSLYKRICRSSIWEIRPIREIIYFYTLYKIIC